MYMISGVRDMARKLIHLTDDAFLNNEPLTDEIRRRAMEPVGFVQSDANDVSERHDDCLSEAYL